MEDCREPCLATGICHQASIHDNWYGILTDGRNWHAYAYPHTWQSVGELVREPRIFLHEGDAAWFRTLDWRMRRARFAIKTPRQSVAEVRARIAVFLDLGMSFQWNSRLDVPV